MPNDFSPVHGAPKAKFGLTQPAFPTQAADHIVLTEEVAYAVAANGAVDFKAPAFGTAHPRSADHKLVGVAFLGGNESKAWYRLTFSKLPGHLLPGSTVSKHTWGAPAVVSKQSVATGTAPATGLGVLQSDVQPQDANVAIATATSLAWPKLVTTHINERGDKETLTQSKVVPGTTLPFFDFTTVSISQQAETKDRATLAIASVAENGTPTGYSILTDLEGISSNRSLLHFVSGAQKRTTHEVVAPGTEPATGFLIMGSEVRAKDVAHSDQSTTTITAWPTLHSSEAVDLQVHGAATTTVETVVPSGSAVDTSTLTMLNVLEAKVEDTNGTHAIQTIKTLAAGASWPTLTTREWDNELAVEITKARTIVAAGTVPVGASILYGTGMAHSEANAHPTAIQVTDEEPIDQYKSWQVVTTIPKPWEDGTAVTTDQTEEETERGLVAGQRRAVYGCDTAGYKFPDLLDVATLNALFSASTGLGPAVTPLYYTQREATLANVQTAKWWVIGKSAPPLPALREILPTDYYDSNTGKNFEHCIHDAGTATSIGEGGAMTIAIPASSPSFSDYMASWCSTPANPVWTPIKARISAVKYHLLYQIETESIQMLGPVNVRPMPTTGAATGISANGATLNGTVNPNGVIANAAFMCWVPGVSVLPVSHVSTITATVGDTVTTGSAGFVGTGSGTSAVAIAATFTGLAPNTTYSYCITVGTNNMTQYGATLTFTTAA